MSDLTEWKKPCGMSINLNSTKGTVAYAESLGWSIEGSNPDKGHGEIGSLQWHTNNIKVMDDKQEIEDYVKEAVGVDIDMRGKLSTVQNKGIKAIKDNT